MKSKRFLITTAILLIVAVSIKIYSNDAARVENGYSTHFYLALASFFRLLFGWLPFSIGDILYGLAAIWLVYKLFMCIKALIKRQVTKAGTLKGLQRALVIILSIYIIFNLFWGINYDRQGITRQLEWQNDTLTYNDLKQVNLLLVEKLNATKTALVNSGTPYPSNNELYKRVAAAYKKAAVVYPFLTYDHISIKTSMWGWFGNFSGFTGYYDPFTGEAQVNTAAPKFMLPYIACHETGHQLGYAKEDEASAVGYLAAANSGDTLLLYSAYFDLFVSSRRELIIQSYQQHDTDFVKTFSQSLLPAVKNDYKEMRDYFNKNKNSIKPLITNGYDFYLKNNNQPGGMHAYDEVTTFLIRYFKKNNRI